jgi:hypothetical protein
MMVVVPIDPEEKKAEGIAEKGRYQGAEHGKSRILGHFEFKDHDGNDDGDDSIAERLHPAFGHDYSLSLNLDGKIYRGRYSDATRGEGGQRGLLPGENKKGRPEPPPVAPKKMALNQTFLIRDKIVDGVPLIRAQGLNRRVVFQTAQKQWNEKKSGKKSSKCPMFHGRPFGSVDADETFGFPQFKKHDSVPGLLLHLVEEYALHIQPLFAGKHLELISTFHALIS